MTFTERDGQLALDFLSEPFRNSLQSEVALQWAVGAWQYAQMARSRAVAADDARVMAKYDWLVEYMRSRLPAWGIAIATEDAG
jgi:hypothetical protein